MGREGDDSVGIENMGIEAENKSHPRLQSDQGSVLNSNFFLENVGEVILTLNSDGLSWKLVKDMEKELDLSSCLGLASKTPTNIKYSDVYAVEFTNWGLIRDSFLPKSGGRFLDRNFEMYRFVVHGFQRSKIQHSLWVLTAFTFGHMYSQTCQAWVEQINNSLNLEVGRPKNLLVFVHPFSGREKGHGTWKTVAPIFSRARVRMKVIVTHRAGHAFDVMVSLSNKELNSYDGVVAVGGDGFFNEILNGLLFQRHKSPHPPAPAEYMQSVDNCDKYPAKRSFARNSSNGSFVLHDSSNTAAETSLQSDDLNPLLPNSESFVSGLSNFRTETGPHDTDDEPTFPIPNKWFRLGIIPAGSTDAIVISTTGARDPVTSALHIILGKRRCLDVAKVVRWKTSVSSTDPPFVRYAASFAGYGFYGDVITESEKFRWMGPKRYDYAGTKVFLRHRSYDAEVAYLDVRPKDPITNKGSPESGTRQIWRLSGTPKKVACRVDCTVCKETVKPLDMVANDASTSDIYSEDAKWLRSKGRFLSVGAAIISCRNDKAPDGLVADAHLSDGFLHLILVKDCPRAFYLWHLTRLAKKGSDPLKFEFVEHHKTTAFTFISSSDESVWNVDGELFQARQLSAQVFRGLITLFAAGPEV